MKFAVVSSIPEIDITSVDNRRAINARLNVVFNKLVNRLQDNSFLRYLVMVDVGYTHKCLLVIAHRLFNKLIELKSLILFRKNLIIVGLCETYSNVASSYFINLFEISWFKLFFFIKKGVLEVKE